MGKDDTREEEEEVRVDESETAEVRRGYRKLMDDIAKNEESLVNQMDVDNSDLLDYLKEGSQLFSRVKAPQEAVMDANVVKNLSRICRQQVQHLSTNINQFKYEEYAEKLRRGLALQSASRLDRKKLVVLGEQAKALFRRSPYLTFMYGALSAIPPEPKDEKTKEKRTRNATKFSDLKETQALTLKETETSDNITDKIVQKVFKVLVEKYKENGKKPINYFKFVLHPTSFGVSIENIFHVSFLVKEHNAGISLCADTGLPLIQPISNKQKDSTEDGNQLQVVMNINMADWKKLVQGTGLYFILGT